MEETVESLKKQIIVLEQRLALYEKDAAVRGYYAINRIVNLQVDYVNSFDIKSNIGKDPKEDKIYDRAKGIWEGLEPMIMSLAKLKETLRLTGDELRDNKKVSFTDRLAEKRN